MLASLGGTLNRVRVELRVDLPQPPLEKPALAVVGHQCERSFVASSRLVRSSEPAQVMRASAKSFAKMPKITKS